MDGTGVGTVLSPPPAQSTVQEAFRCLLGRSMIREGVLLYSLLTSKGGIK